MTLFSHLNVGDKFLFKYEVDQDKISYICRFKKTGDNSYESYDIYVDNRKVPKKLSKKQLGYCMQDTEVHLI